MCRLRAAGCLGTAAISMSGHLHMGPYFVYISELGYRIMGLVTKFTALLPYMRTLLSVIIAILLVKHTRNI